MLEVSKLRERYLKIAESDGISVQELENIEYALEITLPENFKQISQIFDGECLGGVENYSFAQGDFVKFYTDGMICSISKMKRGQSTQRAEWYQNGSIKEKGRYTCGICIANKK